MAKPKIGWYTTLALGEEDGGWPPIVEL